MATDEEELFATLKVSPPIPVGRLAGRFKLQIWRASMDFQLKLCLGSSRGGGEVLVMSDASHLGIYQGDEVLSINEVVVQDLKHAKELLDQSGQQIEIHFYHKESGLLVEDMPVDTACCTPFLCSHRTMPVWCDFFYNPPEPRCRAESWELRGVLAASKATEMPGNIWKLRVQRFSMKQSFGLPFGLVSFDDASELSNLASEDGLLASPRTRMALPVSESFSSDIEVDAYGHEEAIVEPEEVAACSPVCTSGTILLLQSLPLLGLERGDELVKVNGREIKGLRAFQVATKHLMTASLEFHRKAQPLDVASPVVSAMNTPFRRSEDCHSVSTKDYSQDTPDGWSIMYKSSCRPGGQSVETVDAVESSRSLSKSFLDQDLVFL